MNRMARFECMMANGEEIKYQREINVLEYSDYKKCFVEACEDEATEKNTKIINFNFK